MKAMRRAAHLNIVLNECLIGAPIAQSGAQILLVCRQVATDELRTVRPIEGTAECRDMSADDSRRTGTKAEPSEQSKGL
jgi:hypothetical protein